MILEEKRSDLFGTDIPTGEKIRKARTIIGASEDEHINQLESVQAATVHYDLFSEIAKIAKQKNLNIYVYKRNKGGRYHPENKYFYGIFATRAGMIKATHPKGLTDVVARIDEFPRQVNHRKSSKQYKLLRGFLQTIVLAG